MFTRRVRASRAMTQREVNHVYALLLLMEPYAWRPNYACLSARELRALVRSAS